MKKILKRGWSLIALALVLTIILSFYAVTLNRDNHLNIKEMDLSGNAEISGDSGGRFAVDGSMLTSWLVTSPGEELSITFEKPRKVNALLLNEMGHNVKKYSVYYLDGSEWRLCYQQNEIGINRLATFYQIETSGIKIVIDAFKNRVRLADIQVFHLEQRERETPLRVTSYITPQSLNDYDPATNTSQTIDAGCFDVVSDVQFIAYGRFQEDGSVQKEKDADNLEYLKKMIGDRHVNILITIFPPLGYSMADMLRQNMERAVSSVIEYVIKSGTDGADFDWEYPANADEYALYSEFLIQVKKGLAQYGKMLSVALSPWGGSLSQEAIDAIDQVQLMAYDLFDHNGDNNSYAGSTESAVSYMLAQGFQLEQINLGISYYGRPSDASGVWVNYNDPSYHPDAYIMFENNVWFNTPTTVRDKTVYSLLRGLGGIMTFAQDEDLPMRHPLSLTAQAGRAKAAFSSVGVSE